MSRTMWRWFSMLQLVLWTAVACSAADANRPIRVEDYPGAIRVACVGDSITFGSGTANRVVDAYPAQLARMLGGKWEVRNFGVSGSTLLNSGDKPYQKQSAFQQALEFQPNVVVIMLGTNDTKPHNWRNKGAFVPDYQDLVSRFAQLPSRPRIFICLPVPVPGQGNFGINEAGVQEEIPLIRGVATKMQVGLINMYASLEQHPELLPDRVHPNTEGATRMAKTVYRALTGKAFEGPVPAAAASR